MFLGSLFVSWEFERPDVFDMTSQISERPDVYACPGGRLNCQTSERFIDPLREEVLWHGMRRLVV